MVQLNFDATNVAPSAPPEALETGWYPANIIATEMKPAKTPGNSYLEVTHRISSGPAQGRTFKSRLNLQNANQQAVDIAYAELSAMCHAIGRMKIGVAAELHGGALEIFLKKVERNDQPGVMTNDVSGFRAPGAHGAQPGFAGQAGSQANAAPAWANTSAPAAPAAPPAPPAAVAFPPAGWTAHPSAPGYFYQGQEVLSEADLRAKMAAPAAPSAPPAPPAAPAASAPWQSETAPAPQTQESAKQDAPPSTDGTPPWAR